MLEEIAGRLADVRRDIAQAAERSGREPADVRLVAVSKTHSPEAVAAAHTAGHRDFGENYVQELTTKAEALAALEGIRWHAIGPLQRNKVKDVVRVAHVVHTVDRLELAAELGKRAQATARPLDVLVEVSVAGEAQKAGCPPEAVSGLIAALEEHSVVRVVGLMTIPPLADDPEASRVHFRALRELRDRLQGEGLTGLRELSMGMSGDFPVAVSEGATIVRVGTAIFGARPARAGGVL